MNIGKLPNDTLERIVLSHTGAKRDDVLKGPGVGSDCAYMLTDKGGLVLSTDPITAASADAGALSVHVSCNDIASEGVEPACIMITALFPPDITEEEIERTVKQASDAADELGVRIIGGHTEITDAVTRPVLSSVAIGIADSKYLTERAKQAILPGFAIIITKAIGLEGTSIIAKDRENELKSKLTEAELVEAQAMSGDISVVKEGAAIGQIGNIAMHDITEGGVLGAVWEMCRPAGVGCEIEEKLIPISGVTKKICALCGLDPLRLISSGSMLIAARGDKQDAVLQSMAVSGIPAAVIGYVKDAAYGIRMDGELIDPPGADEIYKVYHG